MSELLRRLDGELREATDPLHRVDLLTKMGVYLARTGQFESAKSIVAKIREAFDGGSSARVTARVMLTEGILHLYENMSSKALDRIAGAQALGIAVRDGPLIAISSAWKAHVEFEMSRFESMARSLQMATDYAHVEDHDAQARLAMVLCDAFFLVGDRRSAQVWFHRSHDHAQRLGDQASLEALLYNRAAFNFARLRAIRCFEEIAAEDLSLARLELESAKNLQNLTNIKALTNFVHLCRARLLILEEKYREAIDALDQIRGTRPFADWNFSQNFVDMEIAYCLFALGRPDEAAVKLTLVDRSTFESLDIDERLVAAWMWHSMCPTITTNADAGEADRQLQMLVSQYCQSVDRVKQLLQPYVARDQ